MGTNFYLDKRLWEEDWYIEDEDDPRVHIGKRSAAGLYCWDCRRPLEDYDKGICPLCQKKHEPESLEDSAAGRELGFKTGLPKKKKGVKSAARFIWAMPPLDFFKKAFRLGAKTKIVKDEIGRGYTVKQFGGLLDECTKHDYGFVGRWFS